MPKKILFFLCSLWYLQTYSQDISLYQQFNGRYDYTAIGNTMNSHENGPSTVCSILTSSSADLNLTSDQTLVAAYLYWAGSGSGDFDVTLNGTAVSAERTFADALDDTRVFFAAFADVTSIIAAEGNGTYTLSDLDLTSVISDYCATGTNFAGWAVTIIYEDLALPLNQLNVYDGLQSVPENLSIVLDNLNVLDNEGAKIGFVSWEGDSSLAVNETLTINGNVIGNPPLNPNNNAFNGTNSFTGASDVYNMDIDVYGIQNNINIGDTSATIQLTSGQDFVMINNIITVLNSQLADATVTIDEALVACNLRDVELTFTVYNTNATDVLLADTPIALYADGILVGQLATLENIPIGGSETQSITVTIPDGIPDLFNILVRVDDAGGGVGIINEINEDNNNAFAEILLLFSPESITLEGWTACDIGFDTGIFDLTEVYSQLPEGTDTNALSFYETLDDLHQEIGEILTPSNYQNSTHPQRIFVRYETLPCYSIFEFELTVENCPPVVPQGFSPNEDGYNDWFNIQGLYDVFDQHELLIYNRYGTLIFKGNNDKRWYGRANKGLSNAGDLVPVGTYFYVLHLNDSNYKAMSGWVYLNY